MSKPSTIARGALSALVGLSALGAAVSAPQIASAQPYGYGAPTYDGGYYDPCRRDQTNRGLVGALIGGALGATVGSQAAANHHRTDGSLLGGGLGAIAGAAIGGNSAGCRTVSPVPSYAPPPPPPPPPPQAYYERPPVYRYDNRYDEDDRWAYGPRGQRFRVVDRPVGPDGCTLAESPIYMPDGRVQKRFVRVCMDQSGRYQVVD